MILKTLLSSILLVSFLCISDASAHAGGLCAGASKRIQAAPPEVTETRPFDVLSYDLQLDWRRPFDEQAPIFSGVQEIRIKITSLTPRIVFDASTLHIDSAWINGVRIDPAPQPVDDRLNFDFAISLQPGTEMTIRMAYTRELAIYRGAFFFSKGLAHGFELRDTVLEDIMYTQSEPFDAQFWMPCMNLPYDKADSRISIRVPSGLTGISNGLLENTLSHEDGSKTFVWKSDKPLSTYLMVANASTFVQWEDFYLRPSDPTDTVRTLYFAWPEDYDNTAEDGSEHNPRYAFRNTPEIMLEFTRLLGEYPFEQYGQVPVAPYNYGGMEHQGMTTVNRFWLRGFDELGIAHEIGHHWFGDKVTCETWNDLWLNEGFATYTEGLWTEATLGEEAYVTLVGEHVTSYFDHGTSEISIHGVSPTQAFVWPYSPVVYSKSMAVIHQLRRLVNNDTLFFNSLQDYQKHSPIAR